MDMAVVSEVVGTLESCRKVLMESAGQDIPH